jgi:hypothetical protein
VIIGLQSSERERGIDECGLQERPTAPDFHMADFSSPPLVVVSSSDCIICCNEGDLVPFIYDGNDEAALSL